MAPRGALLAAAIALVLGLAAAGGGHSKTWINKYDPKPNPESVVRHGNARFTVLFDGVIRMEYSASGEFNDDATLAFLHRHTAKPEFTHTSKGAMLTIRTKHMELVYDVSKSSGHFSAANLKVTLLVAPFTVWTPKSKPDGNLHGTIRTLDRVGHAVDLKCQPPTTAMIYYTHCEEGFASRDGWVLVDDSFRPRFDTASTDPEWTWLKGPREDALEGTGAYMDLYFFGNGLNHTRSLGDFTALSGPIPLMPRYALGPQFSRWYAYGEIDSLVNVQAGFAAHGIPLDVYVIDMDWHYTHDRGIPGNPFPQIQVEPWTGYTVYPYQYPELAHFLGYLKRRGVAVTFNMHPAAGVQWHEANYPAMARDMGIDPATGATVAFDPANVTYHRALFKNMIKPLDDAGLQFWWIDFQQGPFSSVPYLNPTIALNYAYWTNPYRFGQDTAGGRGRDRPYVMGRWGGLGGHRYPIGFVGDTYSKWNVLRYESYFMPTASNVGFQWTHDIGGFAGKPEPEMFTRWVQFGVYSPTLRSHSHKSSPPRAIWTIPNPWFSIMRHYYRLRTRLVPYIATAQRLAYDTGVQVVRPMYYAHSGLDDAYSMTAQHQYYFGPDMWAAPIAAPANNASAGFAGLTNWTFWMPPGPWVEHTSGELFKIGPKGAYVSRNYSAWEMPLFSPPGTIVTQRPLPSGSAAAGVLGLSSQVPDDLTLVVLPGVAPEAGASVTRTTRLYDDDGASIDYEDGAYHWTDISCTWTKAAAPAGADSLACTVAPPTGAGFAGFPASRKWALRFPGTWAPASVTLSAGASGAAHAVPYDAFGHPDPLGEDAAWAPGAAAVWSYEGQTLSTWVRLEAPVSTAAGFTVTLTFPAGGRLDDAALTSGFYRKVQRVLTSCKNEFNDHYGIVFPPDVEMLLNVTAAPSRIEAAAGRHGDAGASVEYVRKLITATRKHLKAGITFMGSWRVPGNHTFTAAWQRCMGACHDALAPLSEVPQPTEEIDFRRYEQVMNKLEEGYYGEANAGLAEQYAG